MLGLYGLIELLDNLHFEVWQLGSTLFANVSFIGMLGLYGLTELLDNLLFEVWQPGSTLFANVSFIEMLGLYRDQTWLFMH